MKTTDEAYLIERIAEALSIQQRPTRAWSECSPSTQSYWRASARAVLPILTDVAEALASASGRAALDGLIDWHIGLAPKIERFRGDHNMAALMAERYRADNYPDQETTR